MKNWDEHSGREVFSDMVKYLKKKEILPPKSFRFVNLTRLYYYSTKKYPYLVLIFDTCKSMKDAAKACRNLNSSKHGKLKLQFREMDIEIYNKLFSIKKIGPTDHFYCKGKPISFDDEERISKKEVNEFVINWRTIEKVPEEERWFTYPMILSWDIECHSHDLVSFPQARNMEDEIFAISLTFQRYMKPETKKDIVIVIGYCEDIEGVKVVKVEDEDSLIEAFYKEIEEFDPDITIGYNIFSFDFPYFDSRIKDVGKTWKNIGRLLEEECDIKSLSWNSGAYGYVKIEYAEMPGRIHIDMLPYIKRDHKLPKYDLNTVGKHFIGESKVDLKTSRNVSNSSRYVKFDGKFEKFN